MYDNKTDIYNQPMYLKSEQELIDVLTKTLEQEDIEKQINPVDYEVYFLGEFDTNAGKYELFDKPKHMYGLNRFKGQEDER